MTGQHITAQDFNIFVSSGKFRSASFRKGASPLPPGKQKVHVLTRFNANWQSQSVLQLVGEGGSNLKLSEIIHSQDAQLIDGDKALDCTLVLAVPPLTSAASQSTSAIRPRPGAEQRAVYVVKNAVLTVDGDRSSETVEGGVAYYFGFSGIRMGTGWSAERLSNNNYRVVLDFIDTVGTQEEHASAIWDVDMNTKKVLYRNKYAKNFSWVPSK